MIRSTYPTFPKKSALFQLCGVYKENTETKCVKKDLQTKNFVFKGILFVEEILSLLSASPSFVNNVNTFFTENL